MHKNRIHIFLCVLPRTQYLCSVIKNQKKMTDNKTIGELIELEVRRQGISITGFAEMICCQRNNVYDIFKRDNIDIKLLKNISTLLKRNFFRELAEAPELITDKEETTDEEKNRKAVSQFLEVVPDVLHKLGKFSAIVFCKKSEDEEENRKLPDFGLSDYFITFTIGETLKERMGENPLIQITSVSDDNGCVVELCKNKIYDSVSLNVKVDYKTSDEWCKVLTFVFETYVKQGGNNNADKFNAK